MKKIFLLIFLIICSCGDKENNKSLRVGISADYPPFSYQRNGEFVGFDIDLAGELAKHTKRELVIHDMDFASLVPALQAKRLDIIIASMTVTPEREENLDFSEPYYTPHFAAIYRKLGKHINTPQDLFGKKIGTQLGSTMEMFLKTLPNIEVLSLNKNLQLIQELNNGRVDAVLLEDLQAKKFCANSKELDYLIIKDEKQGYAIAFAKNSQIKKPVTEALHHLKEAGIIHKLKDKWLK